MPLATTPDGSDVIVIGGGAAGLAAALMLGRSRRSVLVIDSGEPRNAPASHMYGYLGHDGIPPKALLATGRDEVGRYGVELLDSRVSEVTRDSRGRFSATLAGGDAVSARRVLVATGLVDVLPDIPGVAEQWGRGVLHCPYCHGWEVRDQELVVIGTGDVGAHQAGLFRQLSSDVTLVVHEGPGPDAETRKGLSARGVTIVDAPVAEVVTDAGDRVTGVRLASGSVLVAGAVVVGPRFVARAEPVASLGIGLVPDPSGLGDVVETDASGATVVPGVYAAGNVSDLRAHVLQAAAAGSRVGAAINADLVAEDTAMALHKPLVTAMDWDQRYAGHDQVWSGRPNGALVAQIGGRPPGRALDVGCGEGADAMWLASQGWDVTAVDVSHVALERAEAVARAAGLTVDWVRSDIVTTPPTPGGYDLVSAQYPALLRTPEHDAVRALLAAVAPNGTLLVVGHAGIDADHGRAHGFDPADYEHPEDFAGHLDDAWEIVTQETRPRTGPVPPDSPWTDDTVLEARRRRLVSLPINTSV